jgi:hypothetical protein
MTEPVNPPLGEIAAALAKAQGEMEAAKKDSENPHFRSKYADLASQWEAWRVVGPKNGLAVVQLPGFDAETGVASVTTLLLHTSGQSLSDTLHAPVQKADPQGVGSALTYLRRYGMAAMVGIAPEDDDAESAVDRERPARTYDSRPASAKKIPGDATKWNGHGGKLLTDESIPVADLAAVRKWLNNKDPQKNADLITALDGEMERRRLADDDGVVKQLDDTTEDDRILAGSRV